MWEKRIVAAEPDIQKPLNLNWDAKGRLWLTHTVEYPYPTKNEEVAQDGVTILDDLDSTGRARKIQRFADKLNIPIGIQPILDGAIVFSIPKIYRLGDTNGEEVADTQHVMFTGFAYQDTHGLQNAFRRSLVE